MSPALNQSGDKILPTNDNTPHSTTNRRRGSPTNKMTENLEAANEAYTDVVKEADLLSVDADVISECIDWSLIDQLCTDDLSLVQSDSRY